MTLSTLVLTCLLVGGGCAIDTGGTHKVEARDSTQTVKAVTEVTTLLEICGIITEGEVVDYFNWTDRQRNCWDELSGFLEEVRGGH